MTIFDAMKDEMAASMNSCPVRHERSGTIYANYAAYRQAWLNGEHDGPIILIGEDRQQRLIDGFYKDFLDQLGNR